MKVLIWTGIMLIPSIIAILVKDSGIILGGIPTAILYGTAFWFANKLCKKWDWHRVAKKASKAGMTVSEYGKHGLSEEFLTKLEKLCNTVPYEKVKSQLKACVRSGKITKEQYIVLLEEYSTTK